MIEALFGPGVVTEEMDPAQADPSLLYPEEEAQVARAVEKRRREYAAGRTCARRALERLGVSDCLLLNGEDRCPRWPEGIVGTIAHTRGWCGVAVARGSDVRGLGLDGEGDAPLKPELEKTILTDRELHWLAEQAVAERGRLAKLFFGAKEAFYKAQYPLTETFLGFHAVELDVDLPGGTFEATLTRDVADVLAKGDRFAGRLLRANGLWLTAVSIGG